MANIIFVCTGNTCRSPMAEGFARKAGNGAKKQGKSCNLFVSRGISVHLPSGANQNAVKTMEKHGIDLRKHMSTQLTLQDILWANYVLTMTEAHKNYIETEFEVNADKIHVLPVFTGMDFREISDPFGGDLQTYADCAEMIKNCIDKLCV